MTYTATGNPGNKAPGSSAAIRAEFAAIALAFAALPDAVALGAGAIPVSNGTAFIALTQINNIPIGNVTPSSGTFNSLGVTGPSSVLVAINSTHTDGAVATLSNSGSIFGQVGSAKGLLGGNLADLAVSVVGANSLFLATNGVKRLTLNATGVGVGSVPTARFQVGETADAAAVFAKFSAGGFTTALEHTGVNSVWGTTAGFGFALKTNDIIRMTIAAGGNATFTNAVTAPNFNGFLVNGNVSQFSNDAGYITSAGAAAAGTLTGTTLASNVVASSLTSLGTLMSLNAIGNVSTLGTFLSKNQEGLRVFHSSGFISGYNDASTVRTGFLQFIVGNLVRLYADTAATNGVSIETAGGTLTITQAGAATFTGTVSSAGFIGTLTGAAPAGSLSGTTLNASVVTSSLTSLGTLGSLTVSGTAAVGVNSTVNSILIGYRGLPAASVTTGAFVAADAGKCVFATAGVTVPNSTMVAGDVVVIQNTTGSAITITATITTLRQTGTANTGNRTLAAYGRCAIVFTSGTLGFISGDVT